MICSRTGEEILNPFYVQHVKQDSSLASWLLSTISPHLLPKFVGSDTPLGVWNVVFQAYFSLSTTKAMNLHCRLHSMKKSAQSMNEYTMAIKQICDLLAACGSSISEVEHIATILNGLPIEYEPTISAITASKESYSIENIMVILVDAKTRMEDSLRFSVGINYTRHTPRNVMVNDNNEPGRSQGMDQDSSRQSYNARNKGKPRPQCQLCGKLGHLVDRCWHRFDQNFKGVSSQQDRNTPRAQANTCSCSHTPEVNYNLFVADNRVSSVNALDEDIQVTALIVDDHVSFHKWFPDSGSTNHVTSDVSALRNKDVYTENGKVHLGDGISLSINHIGNIFIESNSRSL
ncbi:hypothetical protein HRI_000302800 [Hibiscus trionum]|uniref:Retrovirus-related Pol polyprotein from transposon TNT 1-94-like beta-barrel domain-containing protein n=1 Tax=Hibiscus trionum TaxID=183268 RepID=A0A9W7LK68_HIBTR|nr:hypothetical protein HRI_000302800 [Hibiscus trionum]